MQSRVVAGCGQGKEVILGAFEELARELAEGGETSQGGRVQPDQKRASDKLVELGAARWNDAGLTLVPPFDLTALCLFAPLLDALRPELFDISLDDFPYVLMAAFPGAGSRLDGVPEAAMRSVVSGGQGRAKAKAVLSCLGELAERATLLRRRPEDGRVVGRSGGCVDLNLGEVLGFSRQQEAVLLAARPHLEAFTGEGGRIDWNSVSVDRLRGLDLSTGEPVSVPACGVFVETDRTSPFAGLGLGSTVGAAVWRDLEGARQRALLELVERDAVARAWYNRLGITRLCEASWSQVFDVEVAQFIKDRARTTWILTLDCEFSAHVVVALSHTDGGLEAAFGSSAGLTYAQAAESALSEMLQSERSHAFALRSWQVEQVKNAGASARPLPPPLAYGASVDVRQDLGLLEARMMDEIPSEIFSPEDVLESCLADGIRLYEVDVTEPGLKIPCVKILSPDLASWQPRFGKRRLFLGGRSEAEFAARPFPF